MKLTIFSILCFSSFLAFANETDITTSPQESEKNTLAEPEYANLPVQQVSNLAKAFDLIRANYIEYIDDETLLRYALEGMVEKLDPHSSYLAQDSLENFTQATTGKFTGLGIEITMQDGLVKIISAFDGSPAKKAGILSGDLIYELDGQLIKGLSLKQASELMRGEIGTDIELKIKREGSDEPVVLNITREEIKQTSIKTQLLDKQIAYSRISSFQSETGIDYELAIQKLIEESKDLQAVILDLRNNPGGHLLQAVKVSDVFLQEKLVVYTQGREQESKEEHFTSLNTVGKDLKLIVLINPGSASASEIVAGAMQDHKRALIIGQTSFGKASVQQLFYLDQEQTKAVKLTIARYFTPNGHSIQANGISPDIMIEPSIVSKKQSKEYISEAKLAGHISSQDLEPVQDQENNSIESEKQLDLLEDDYVLQQAYQLLKGAIILK